MTELEKLIEEQKKDDTYTILPDYNGQPRKLGDRLAGQTFDGELYITSESVAEERDLMPAFEVIIAAKLSPRERLVFYMRVAGDHNGPMSFKAIGEMVSRRFPGMNEEGARQAFKRAKEKINAQNSHV